MKTSTTRGVLIVVLHTWHCVFLAEWLCWMLCFDSALLIHGLPSVPLSHYTSYIWVVFSLCSSVCFFKRQTALLTVSTPLMNVRLRCCMCLLITQPQCLCSYKSPQPVDVFWKQSGVICSSCLGSRTDQQFTQSYWLLSRETLVWHFRHPRCEGHSLCNLFARAQPGVVSVFETNKRSEDVLFWGELKQTVLVTSSPTGSWLQQFMSNSLSVSFSGDSFTQFRFSEEKNWEMDSFAASQVNLYPAHPTCSNSALFLCLSWI